MRRGSVAIAIPSVALIGLPVMLHGLEGPGSELPGLDGCATSMSQGTGYSYAQARTVCAGRANSIRPDLASCAASMAQVSSRREAEKVCKNGPSH
jgi:hypothetical protein